MGAGFASSIKSVDDFMSIVSSKLNEFSDAVDIIILIKILN